MDPLATGERVGKLLDSGQGGVVTVLCIVIVALLGVVAFLYRKVDALNEKRAETAARVEAALTASKLATEGMVTAVNVVTGLVREGMNDLGTTQEQIATLSQAISNWGSAISEMRSTLLPELIRRSNERGGGR